MIFTDAMCRTCLKEAAAEGLPFCPACLLTLACSGSAPGMGMDTLPPGTRVGRFVLRGWLGRGGFADVYSATEQGKKKAPVALKLIRHGMNSREVVARFRVEQRLLRQLDHPGIVKIMDSGVTPDGRPFFVMEQLESLPVTEFCQVADLTVEARLELFAAVCDAVQHAHQKAVLHRDLKPGNILVVETPAGPQPKIIDFGIAKALESSGTGETMATRVGQVVGTLAYISPEQAGGTDEADTRSDIYSLGAVLYEMLTGGPPVPEEEIRRLPSTEWTARLREKTPPPPSVRLRETGGPAAVVRCLAGDLDLIVMKAMAAESGRRHASAAALAEDVRHWLSGEPVSARPPSAAYQLRRYVRRYRWQVATLLAGLAAVLATSVMGFLLAVSARTAARESAAGQARSVRAEASAVSARSRAEHESYQSSLQLAQLHMANREPFLAVDSLEATLPSLRGWEWQYLRAALPRPEAAAGSGLPSATVVAATPDGSIAAVAKDLMIHVVDMRAGTLAARLPQPAKVEGMALSPDGKLMAVLLKDTLRVCRMDGSTAWEADVLREGGGMAWEPDGGALLLVSGNARAPSPGRLERRDRETGRVLAGREILRHKLCPRSLSIGSGGRFAAVRRSYHLIEIIRLPTLEPVSLPVSTNQDNDLCTDFLLDEPGKRLLMAVNNSLVSYSLSDGARQTHELIPSAGKTASSADVQSVRRLNLLPDNRWMALSDTLSLTEGSPVAGRPVMKSAGALSLSGGRFLILTRAGRLEIHQETSPDPPVELPFAVTGPDREARRVAFSPDSATAVIQTWDRQGAWLFRPDPAARGSLLSTLLPTPRRPELEWSLFPVFHPDGSVLLSGNSCIERWLPGKSAAPEPLPIPWNAWSAAPSADGRTVAFGTPRGVEMLDWKTKAITAVWPLKGGPFAVFAGPDAESCYALGCDLMLHRLGGQPPAVPLAIGPPGTRLPCTAWDAGRQRLAVRLNEGVVLYQLSSDAPPRHLQTLELGAHPSALAFDPGGGTLAVGTQDGAVTLWDWEYALPLMEFRLRSACTGIAYSPDGRWLANTDYNPPVTLRGPFLRTNQGSVSR